MDFVSAALGVGGLLSNTLANQTNQANFERQQKFAEYQYKDMKQYNSAAEQVKRLRAAGLNPALVFGGDSGMASSVSQPSPNPQSSLDLSGLSSLAEGINMNDLNARNIKANTEKVQEETHGYNIDNLFKHEDWISKLYNRDTESWLKNQLSESARLAVMYDKQSLNDRLWEQKMSSQLMQARAYAQFYVNEYIPLHQQVEIDNLVAQSAVAYQQGRASLQQAHAAIMNAESTKRAFDAQYGGNPAQRSKFFKATLDYLLQQKKTAESQEFSNYGDTPNFGPVGRRRQYDPKTKSWRWVYAK